MHDYAAEVLQGGGGVISRDNNVLSHPFIQLLIICIDEIYDQYQKWPAISSFSLM